MGSVQVVLTLRARGVTVVGLWKIPKLPNFKDGKYFDPYVTLGKENQVIDRLPSVTLTLNV